MRLPNIAHLLLGCAVAVSACGGPTPDKINTWKTTQKGPQKLHDVVADDAADPAMRGLAVAALVEIGTGSDALAALATSPDDKRAPVVHEAISPLAQLLGTSATLPGPTTQTQRGAKDALFELRPWAAAPDRTRIDTLLVQWTTAELTARSSQGGESSEKILTAIGPGASAALVPLVTGPDQLTASRLLGTLGDPAAKKQAAQKIEAAVRGAPAGLSGVSESNLQALGLVGGEEATRFLLEVANKGGTLAREKALYALAQGHLAAGDVQALAGALAIAGDAKAPPGSREAAFQVLEKLGPSSVPGLVRLFGDPNTVVRFRSVEASLKAGGTGAIDTVLHALPQDKPIPSADLDSFVVHDVVLLGKDAVAPVVAVIAKKSPLAQVAAIRALGQLGTSKDASALEPALSDQSVCTIIKPAATVSMEAQKAKAAMSGRK